MDSKNELSKQVVYKLVHMYEREDEDEIKELGLYSTYENAQKAIERYRFLKGFNEHPVECFLIDECELDKDAAWTEGFINTAVIEQKFQKFADCVQDWIQDIACIKEKQYIDNDFLYHLECEMYKDVCFMTSVDDIANYIKKFFEERFEKINITSEQYLKLANSVLAC